MRDGLLRNFHDNSWGFYEKVEKPFPYGFFFDYYQTHVKKTVREEGAITTMDLHITLHDRELKIVAFLEHKLEPLIMRICRFIKRGV